MVLEAIWERIKPRVTAAIEAGKVSLAAAVGERNIGIIGRVGLAIDSVLANGLPPISPKVRGLLAGLVAVAAGLGLYRRATPKTAGR